MSSELVSRGLIRQIDEHLLCVTQEEKQRLVQLVRLQELAMI